MRCPHLEAAFENLREQDYADGRGTDVKITASNPLSNLLSFSLPRPLATDNLGTWQRQFRRPGSFTDSPRGD